MSFKWSKGLLTMKEYEQDMATEHEQDMATEHRMQTGKVIGLVTR